MTATATLVFPAGEWELVRWLHARLAGVTMTSLPVTAEDSAVYRADDPARALAVAGDRARYDAGRLVILAANGRELHPQDGQVIVRYAPGDIGVMDPGELARWFGRGA